MPVGEQLPSFVGEQARRGLSLVAVFGDNAPVIGRDGVAELVSRTCRLARRFAAGLAEAGFTVLNDVVLNQVVVDLGAPARAAGIIDAVQREGTCWCGPTSWRGRAAMRVSVSCWATTEADIDASVAAIRACARG